MRGRPLKFGRPSQAVTVTLPEDVIARLRRGGADLGQSIVDLVEQRPADPPRPNGTTERVAFGRHAVIVVPPVAALRRLPGVELIPIGPHRALISLAPPQSVAQLELDIRDLLDRGRLTDAEREALEGVSQILRETRVSPQQALVERTVIVLEARRTRR